ncbi:hypothetical protein [Pseudomonas putida]|uniref:Uncharacterized protein n=1 Tax=Pseudomonas putida TaxID=303 RepID=A0A1Q9R264_PSEPU|nr:hypothetical protein [Pseudomonas putida]OLS61493.1 hypothetical protein PSEMO_35600 [Pseudomonas putida]
MNDYDIDTTGFELGSPTYIETLKHQSGMLCAEIHRLQLELAHTKELVKTLVEINQELNDRITAEYRRANAAYVDYVNLYNYARWSYGIDLARDDEERERARRLNERLKDKVRASIDEPMRRPSLPRPHGLMPDS